MIARFVTRAIGIFIQILKINDNDSTGTSRNFRISLNLIDFSTESEGNLSVFYVFLRFLEANDVTMEIQILTMNDNDENPELTVL